MKQLEQCAECKKPNCSAHNSDSDICVACGLKTRENSPKKEAE